MEPTNPNQQGREQQTMSDEEFFAARRETMGEDYPGDDAMRQFDRDADAQWQRELEADRAAEAQAQPQQAATQEAPATASAEAKEWNAREWLNETFKDDPGFKDLSPEDMSRLEAMANEKHAEFAADIQDWASEKGAEWSGEMKDAIREGLGSNPDTQNFFESRLADGDFSDADKAELEALAKDMTPQEGARVIHPIVEELHEIHGDIIDGVEMIADHAIDDVREIVDARAEMPGGDHESVQKLQQELEEAPAKIHDALDWEREQADREWGKVEDRLELIEAGVDPSDIPPDPDTYQIDDNADQYETEAA